jgi:hypothetical protein
MEAAISRSREEIDNPDATSRKWEKGLTTWLEEIEKETGRTPIIYTRAEYWNRFDFRISAAIHCGSPTTRIPIQSQTYRNTGRIGHSGNFQPLKTIALAI